MIVSLLHVMTVREYMYDELFPLRALIAAQNCLGSLALVMFST